MKRLSMKEVKNLRSYEGSDFKSYLFYDGGGKMALGPKTTKLVIVRGGFENTNGQYFDTFVRVHGFVGEYNQDLVDKVLSKLKRSRYAPQFDHWRLQRGAREGTW